jgi:O-antigen/teichoic acid export membrane protein
MEIFRKGIKSSVYHILGASIGFFLQFIVARLLGTTEFGRYNYFFGLASSISIIFSFGIAFYLPKVFQQSINKERLFSGIIFSSGIIFVIFFVIFCYFYSPLISSTTDYIILFLLSWLLFVMGYYRSFLVGIYSADKASLYGNFLLRGLTLLGFIVLVLLFGTKYLAILLALLFAHLIILSPFLIRTIKYTRPNFQFLKHASIFYFIQLFYMFFGEYAKVLQGEFLGLEAVAFLSISVVIGQMITLFGANFANVALPIFASAYKERNMSLLDKKFQETARINAFFVLPIFFFLIFNSDLVLGIFGAEYKEGNLILLFILSGSFINSFVGPNGSLLLMSGNEKWELLNGVIKFIIAFSISILLGKKFIWGIALGLAVSDIVVNLLKVIEVYYFFRIVPFNRNVVTYLIYIILFELALFISLKMISLDIVYIFMISILLIILSWAISFSRSPNKSDRDIYAKALSICRDKIRLVLLR